MRPVLAAAVLTAVIIGGFFIGATRAITGDWPDW